METILNKKEMPELDKMVTFLKSLTVEEQKMFSMLMQGFQLAKRLPEKQTA